MASFADSTIASRGNVYSCHCIGIQDVTPLKLIDRISNIPILSSFFREIVYIIWRATLPSLVFALKRQPLCLQKVL